MRSSGPSQQQKIIQASYWKCSWWLTVCIGCMHIGGDGFCSQIHVWKIDVIVLGLFIYLGRGLHYRLVYISGVIDSIRSRMTGEPRVCSSYSVLLVTSDPSCRKAVAKCLRNKLSTGKVPAQTEAVKYSRYHMLVALISNYLFYQRCAKSNKWEFSCL